MERQSNTYWGLNTSVNPPVYTNPHLLNTHDICILPGSNAWS
jgi:hypothetical protein